MFLQRDLPIVNTLRGILTVPQVDPDWSRMPFMLTGAHYKTGTEILQEVDAAMVKTLAQQDPAGRAVPYYRRHGYGFEVGIGTEPAILSIARSTDQIYANLTSRQFRFVHAIRDPIEMVISAYWYLIRQQVDIGWGPGTILTLAEVAQLQKTNVITGLEIVARGVLKHTISDILGFLNTSRGDVRVMTVGLEDFESDFNKTVSCMYRFLLEPVMPQTYKSLASSALGAAQAADARRRKAATGTNAKHFNSDENKTLSRNLIAASTNPVWGEIRKARHEFGYLATQDPGRFRLPWPAQCSFA